MALGQLMALDLLGDLRPVVERSRDDPTDGSSRACRRSGARQNPGSVLRKNNGNFPSGEGWIPAAGGKTGCVE